MSRAIQLEQFGHGRILPHEKTFPAAKEDRLELLAALNANVSSVFGLYSGADSELDALISAVRRTRPARGVQSMTWETKINFARSRTPAKSRSSNARSLHRES